MPAFTINFLLTANGSPIEARHCNVASPEAAVQHAEQLIRNTTIAGVLRGPGVGFAIEDAAGAYIGTWFNGKRIDA